MAFDPQSIYARTVIEKVLSIETNDARFESFCNSVVSHIEGGAIIIGTTAREALNNSPPIEVAVG